MQRLPETVRGTADTIDHVALCSLTSNSIDLCNSCAGLSSACRFCTQRFAEAYNKTIFLKFFGNANAKTKALFRDRLSTPQTPHFTFWRNGGSLRAFEPPCQYQFGEPPLKQLWQSKAQEVDRSDTVAALRRLMNAYSGVLQ